MRVKTLTILIEGLLVNLAVGLKDSAVDGDDDPDPFQMTKYVADCQSSQMVGQYKGYGISAQECHNQCHYWGKKKKELRCNDRNFAESSRYNQ